MTKNQYIRVLLFGMLLIGMDQLMGTLVHKGANAYQYDTRLGQLLNKNVQPQVLVMGSSRALNNYNAELLSESWGKSAFNIGYSGSGVSFHADLFELLLHQEVIPETLIYNLDDSATLFATDGVIYRTEALYPYVDNAQVDSLVCVKRGKNFWASRLSLSFRNNVNFSNALSYLVFGQLPPDFRITNVDNWGANLMKGTTLTAQDHMVPDTVLLHENRMDWDQVHALQRLVHMAEIHEITVICVAPPLRTLYSKNFVSMVQSQIPGTPIIDLSHASISKDGFYNKSHLNKQGATEFTQMLIKQLEK